jgi:hypothetical protein
MKSKVILFYIILLPFLSCSKDEISEDQSASFIKFFGTASRNVSSDIKPYPENGYVVLGSVNTPDNGNQIYVAKTNEYGNLVEEPLIFGGPFADVGHSMYVHDNGSIYIVGSTIREQGAATDMVLYIIDGREVSEPKTFGGRGNEVGYHVRVTETGIVMVGYTDSQNGSKDVYLVFANRNGDELWSQHYGSRTGEDIGNNVIPYGDDFLITGSTNYNAQANVSNNKNIWILHAKPRSSNLLNSIFLGEEGDDQGIELLESSGGNLYLAGTMHDNNEDEPKIYLARFDGKLNMVWQRTYTELPALKTADICLWDENLVVVGTNEPGENSSRISLVVTDENGDLITEKYFGDESGLRLSATSVEMTMDNGLIIGGTNESFGSGVITAIKLDQNGNL